MRTGPIVSGQRSPWLVLLLATLVLACGSDDSGPAPPNGLTVDGTATTARTVDGDFIHWREHLIDAREVNGGLAIRGGDGLAMADLDDDGIQDIVSVHEDSGHVRIAFGSSSGPDRWQLATLADTDVEGAEDVAIGDLSGDGALDIVVACERGHLAYFQNPGNSEPSTEAWESTVPSRTRGRGSFIRVSIADLDGDGSAEVVAANKGLVMADAGTELTPSQETILAILGADPTPISIFYLPVDPIDGEQWDEHELGRYRVPINSQAVDLDGDGDVDIVGGGRGELRGLLWFENVGPLASIEARRFVPHIIELDEESRATLDRLGGLPFLSGQTIEFHDFDRDGRVDILTGFTLSAFGWLEQPNDPLEAWRAHLIGNLGPDHHAGMSVGDIDGDGTDDVMIGGYSKGRRDADADAEIGHPLGRLVWFKSPTDPRGVWTPHDISRRTRGMFDEFVARDLDHDGDLDFVGTRGNSTEYDGVYWLEQRRSPRAERNFESARKSESAPRPLPD